MSASISGTNISLTRGDTLRVTVNIEQGGVPYVPNPGDRIRFAMKRRIDDEEPIILKDIPTDTLLLRLESEDTKNLPFGTYKYDIELTTVDGDVDTFIGPSNFTLTDEVY